MNYLAHFFLAGSDDGLLIGNFIADDVKGSSWQTYPEHVQKGILMHRAIDHFTDTHELSSKAKDLLRPEFNHYSGVILDVFFDHFLARDFELHTKEKLASFSQRTYSFLETHAHTFPERPRMMLPYMRKYDWLMAYAQIEGVHRVLTGMSKRVRHESGMERAAAALEKDYLQFEELFSQFFPQIISHTEDFRIVSSQDDTPSR